MYRSVLFRPFWTTAQQTETRKRLAHGAAAARMSRPSPNKHAARRSSPSSSKTAFSQRRPPHPDTPRRSAFRGPASRPARETAATGRSDQEAKTKWLSRSQSSPAEHLPFETSEETDKALQAAGPPPASLFAEPGTQAAWDAQCLTKKWQRPSQIQGMAFRRLPSLLSASIPSSVAFSSDAHQNIVLASETGSGKTAAYLLPIIQMLKQEEVTGSFVRGRMQPRAIVLVPTKELVRQVQTMAKDLAHHAKFRALAVTHSMKAASLTEKLETPVDLLITTPARLVNLNEELLMSVAHVRALVIDEADTLLGEKYDEHVMTLIVKLKGYAETQKRVLSSIMVSATIPQLIANTIQKAFPTTQYILSPQLHRPPVALKHVFVNLKAETADAKPKRLIDLLLHTLHFPVLVFCNTVGSAQNLTTLLTTQEKYQRRLEPLLDSLTPAGHTAAQFDDSIACLHGYLPHDMRDALMKRFDATPSIAMKNDPTSKNVSQPRAKAEERDHLSGDAVKPVHVLITTDIASRGLDTRNVQTVILYDFPHSAVDYLHRAGRTARAGDSGRVISIINKKEKDRAWRINDAIRKKTTVR